MTPTTEQERFRIVLIRSNTRDVLVSGEQDAFHLPAVTIPPHTRHAEQIVAAIADAFCVETYCLFSVPPDTNFPHQYAFACTTLPNAQPPSGFRWVSAASISSQAFLDSRDYLAYSSGFEDVHQYERNPKAGYFARPSWLQEILEWTERQLVPLKMRLTGAYRQLNASATFCLLRLPTERSAVWFKAVDRAILPELPITLYLAQHFPAYVPRIIAQHRECNGWLTEEASGSHPDAQSPRETWLAVADSLAELQIASIGHCLHLLEAGSRDVRCGFLRDTVPPFFETMARLMEKQKTASPPPLTSRQLASLESIVLEAISSTEELEVPSTLGHLDFNLGNIVVGPSRVMFLDWAAASVGHPFSTLEYLLEGLRSLRPSDRSLHAEVSSAYIRKWRSLVGTEQLAAALATAPLLAAFTYASAEGAWRNPSQLRDPARTGHLRSLTRRMHREAETWIAGKTRDASCLQAG
jgi:Phosphotransferase enzyme family